ncbi:hypothetical protein [Actinoplanes sp. L3-i22]|uniref:hypothetical protein n=1 Tax=Actinoplanes sp. L3-i22 TaxID=2836373 RepID=UPI00210357D5|nr:hypothetical protein [Actinoplanes sp. L3-i22]
MNLRRSISSRVFAVFGAALLAGLVVFLVSWQVTEGLSARGLLLVGFYALVGPLLGATAVRYAFQPFEVGVDPDGWTVRIGRYRRDVRWAEISAVVIENRPVQTRRRAPVPALFLVPEPGVSLDPPSDLRATVDGRPAVRLFDLSDPKIDEQQFVRDLAILAGDRLEVRLYPLGLALLTEDGRKRLNEAARGWLDDGRALPAFPPGAAGRRTQRWLNRRRFVLFVGWYLLAVLPALLLTGFAARVYELLGAAVAVLGLLAVLDAYDRFVTLFSRATELVEHELVISGTDLVQVIGDGVHRWRLHDGKAVVLPPKRGYGKAWVLGLPHPVMLLGDPRTGRLRDHEDLRALAAVLSESPHEADRAAAREVDSLAGQSRVGDPAEPGGAGGALWMSLTKAGRVLAWAVVVSTVLVAGGWILESARYLGGAVIILGLALAVVWAGYALFRISGLVGAAWQAIRKSH